MSDRDNVIGHGAFDPDPAQDQELGALLREEVGAVPNMNWEALTQRITARVATHASSSWWSYAARWERRMVPIALAAGIAAALTLFTLETTPATTSTLSAASVSTAIASGASFEESALQFAHTVTSTADITAGIPE